MKKRRVHRLVSWQFEETAFLIPNRRSLPIITTAPADQVKCKRLVSTMQLNGYVRAITQKGGITRLCTYGVTGNCLDIGGTLFGDGWKFDGDKRRQNHYNFLI